MFAAAIDVGIAVTVSVADAVELWFDPSPANAAAIVSDPAGVPLGIVYGIDTLPLTSVAALPTTTPLTLN